MYDGQLSILEGEKAGTCTLIMSSSLLLLSGLATSTLRLPASLTPSSLDALTTTQNPASNLMSFTPSHIQSPTCLPLFLKLLSFPSPHHLLNHSFHLARLFHLYDGHLELCFMRLVTANSALCLIHMVALAVNPLLQTHLSLITSRFWLVLMMSAMFLRALLNFQTIFYLCYIYFNHSKFSLSLNLPAHHARHVKQPL